MIECTEGETGSRLKPHLPSSQTQISDILLRQACSIEQYNQSRRKNMGCTDSQINSPDPSPENPTKTKAIHFAPQVEDDSALPDHNEQPKLKKNKSKSKGKRRGPEGERSGEAEGSELGEKENTVRVRKARNLRHHPEHEKFIEDIMQQSRAKVAADFPQIPKSSSGFIKPVVEYTPAPKGQILPNESKLSHRSRWNIPISEAELREGQKVDFSESYVSINEAAKSPYRQKEIERRLNGIRNGRFQESQSGQLSRHRAAPFEDMECTYLQ